MDDVRLWALRLAHWFICLVLFSSITMLGNSSNLSSCSVMLLVSGWLLLLLRVLR